MNELTCELDGVCSVCGERCLREENARLKAKLARCVDALDAAAIALGNQAIAAGSWHEDEMRMDAAREAGKAARAALAAAKGE